MLIVQPAEERVLGARAMRDDKVWERFGTPDYALAFHVGAGSPAGKIDAPEGPSYAGMPIPSISSFTASVLMVPARTAARTRY